MKTTKLGRSEVTYTSVETLGVLAGAYRDQSLKSLLTHLAFVDGTDIVRAGCRGVKVDNLADESTGARPTCEACAKVWDRLQAEAAQ